MKTRLCALLLLVCMIATQFSACDSSVPETNENKPTENPGSNTETPPEDTTSAHQHTFNEWTTIKEPTCTENGLEQRFCSGCHYTESNTMDAKGHTKEILAKEDATCISYGTKEGFYCTTCNYYETPIDYDVIPTGEHDFTYSKLKDGAVLSYCSKCYADTFDVGPRNDINWKKVYQGNDVAWDYRWEKEAVLIPTRYDFITYIMPDMFKSCDYALGAIVMLENITYIGSSAFENCEQLTYVEFTTSVTKIESKAFANCESLLCIRYNGTTAEWNAIEKGTDWDAETGNYTVICSDGNITKS